MSEKVFLQGDADAIKTYVFEVPGLPQIRGGSQHLVECEEAVEKLVEQLGGQEIYCSGGGFLFEVPADRAEEIKREIERIYLQRTLVATVTVVYEGSSDLPSSAPDVTDGWAGRLVKAHKEAQQAGDFARRTAFLAARLREAKQQKEAAPFLEIFPFGKRCDICGRRVAEYDVTYTEGGTTETKQLCQVCHRRHQTGCQKRNETFEDFAKHRGLSLKARPAQDLDKLVESARRGYLAFLYADGNNIGGLLQKVRDEREYRALSDALNESAQKALFEALWEECQQVLQKEEVWPFEILNIGGDDVTLLIQAGYAWDVAIAFLERFEDYVRQEVEQTLGYWPDTWGNITASVGIAIADAKHPVRYVEALASDLLKRAKKTARDSETSAIDFLWLPNAVAVTQADMMADLYRRGDLVLTVRPYTLAQARVMQDVVKDLSEWPRSLRHRWGEALERGRWASLGLILYDLARRLGQNQQVQKFIDALQSLRDAFSQDAPMPMGYLWWKHRENGRLVWRTTLLDALELAELQAMRPDVEEEDE